MVRTSKLRLYIHRLVWCKEVVSLLVVLIVVEITMAYIEKAPRIVSSAVIPVISRNNVPRVSSMVIMGEIDLNLHQLFHLIELHLGEPLLVLVKG